MARACIIGHVPDMHIVCLIHCRIRSIHLNKKATKRNSLKIPPVFFISAKSRVLIKCGLKRYWIKEITIIIQLNCHASLQSEITMKWILDILF